MLPLGFTEEDILTYVYDRQYHRWMVLQRDSINRDKQLFCSRVRTRERGPAHTPNNMADPQEALSLIQFPMLSTSQDGGDAPLDFINAVMKTPQMPETSSYTPTSIKELKAANPLEGLFLMQPPTANNRGMANLNYPLLLPAGRQCLQPHLTLTYSSNGGNSWLGTGWDISLPSIIVETRWGVPRYDTDKESETYLLNGEQLVTKDSNNNYEPLSHRVVWQNRDTSYSEKQFYSRVEGVFMQIFRHGTHPKNYWWEVRDKQGIAYYYGKKRNANVLEPDEVFIENSGHIAQWMLTEVRNLNGNAVHYQYQTLRQGYGDYAPRNIYPKRDPLHPTRQPCC